MRLSPRAWFIFMMCICISGSMHPEDVIFDFEGTWSDKCKELLITVDMTSLQDSKTLHAVHAGYREAIQDVFVDTRDGYERASMSLLREDTASVAERYCADVLQDIRHALAPTSADVAGALWAKYRTIYNLTKDELGGVFLQVLFLSSA